MAETNNLVIVRLIYPHQIGDRIEILGAVFERDGEHHYALVNQALADSIVNAGCGEIVNA